MQPVNRRLSRHVTPVLIAFHLSPNQVTLLGFGAGCMAAWNFLHGGPFEQIAGALWFQIFYVLDNCDGEVARLTGKISGFGSWIDTLSDCVIHMVFFAALGISAARYSGQPLWLKMGLLASAGVLFTYVAFLIEQFQLRGRAALLHPDPPWNAAPAGFLRQMKKIFREDFSFVVLISAFFQNVSWLIWAGVIGSFLIGLFELLAAVCAVRTQE